MRHIYAKIETNFPQDARMKALTPQERWTYICIWCLAVATRKATITPEASTNTYLANLANTHHTTVISLIKKASNFSEPLLKRESNGGLTVCGVTKLHPTLFNQNMLIGENRREHNTREQERTQKHPSPPSAVASENQTPPTPQNASNEKKLPWLHETEWLCKNLHRFNTIPNWVDFASKILVTGIDEAGIPLPELQEKLLDSSAYLETNTHRYVGGKIRKFYWDQVSRYRNSTPEPKSGRKPDLDYSADEEWPEGITMKVGT